MQIVHPNGSLLQIRFSVVRDKSEDKEGIPASQAGK